MKYRRRRPILWIVLPYLVLSEAFSRSTSRSSFTMIQRPRTRRCYDILGKQQVHPVLERNPHTCGSTINDHFSSLCLSNIRGGSDDGTPDSSKLSRQEKKRQQDKRGMTVALSAAYFTVMAAKCALPAVLPLLLSPTTGLTYHKPHSSLTAALSPEQHMARLLTLSTLAVATGKFLLGPVIDVVGGIRSLQIALLGLAVLLLQVSACQSFDVFFGAWILVDFIFSSCWAASIHAIHQVFDAENEWSRQIGHLAASARLGNAVAFSLFASLLQTISSANSKVNNGSGIASLLPGVVRRQPWRAVFAVAGLLQVVSLGLLSKHARDVSSFIPASPPKRVKAHRRNEKAVMVGTTSSWWETLTSAAGTLEFWLHLISRSALMVTASFLLFVPTLQSQVYGAPAAWSAQTGSVYALGCLLAILVGTPLYSRSSANTRYNDSNRPDRTNDITHFPSKGFVANRLRPLRHRRAIMVASLLSVSTLSSVAQLAHVMGIWTLTAKSSAFWLFLWGFSFAVPFYLPASMYALKSGGGQSSATIADVFDVGGFGLLALFNGYVAGIQHGTPSAWIPTFCLTTACGLVSLVTLTWAVLRDENP